MLLVLNYHYVQPQGRYAHPGIHPTTAAELAAQLTVVGRDFEFVSGAALLRAITGESDLPERACLVTFDDGLQEQYGNAAPVLDRLGISAVFFVSTLPLRSARALAVHKMHWLRATRSPEAFLTLASAAASSIGCAVNLEQVEDTAAARQYLYDDLPTKRIKYLFNHVLPLRDRERLIDAMFSTEMDEDEFRRSLYMTETQVADLATRHAVGSHTHTHCPLASLPPGDLRDELARSAEILRDVTHRPVEFVSYPYGGPTAVSVSVATAARALGYSAGFTTERSVNATLDHPLLLARLATNDAPGGTSPLLTVADGRLTCAPPMTACRSVFVQEPAIEECRG